jgi:hypothetical protein
VAMSGGLVGGGTGRSRTGSVHPWWRRWRTGRRRCRGPGRRTGRWRCRGDWSAATGTGRRIGRSTRGWRRYGLVGGGDVGFVGPQAATLRGPGRRRYRDRLSDRSVHPRRRWRTGRRRCRWVCRGLVGWRCRGDWSAATSWGTGSVTGRSTRGGDAGGPVGGDVGGDPGGPVGGDVGDRSAATSGTGRDRSVHP